MKKFNQAKHMLFRHVLILLGVMVTSVSAFCAASGERNCYRRKRGKPS